MSYTTDFDVIELRIINYSLWSNHRAFVAIQYTNTHTHIHSRFAIVSPFVKSKQNEMKMENFINSCEIEWQKERHENTRKLWIVFNGFGTRTSSTSIYRNVCVRARCGSSSMERKHYYVEVDCSRYMRKLACKPTFNVNTAHLQSSTLNGTQLKRSTKSIMNNDTILKNL